MTAAKPIDEVLAGVALMRRGKSDAASPAMISGVQYDSRRVEPGYLFVAMRGGSTDGNQYIGAAVAAGAVAVVTDSLEAFEGRFEYPAVAFFLAAHGRRALAEASAGFYGHPEKKLKISAVTGTNGKTTTAFLLEQMLRSVGRKCVLLGTIETHIGEVVKESEHTTPESRDVLALFAEAVDAGCTEAVMEMSSHALAQERVWGLPVDVAMFTNLTQDHLDYHGSMGAYAASKARIFEGVGSPPPRVAVINEDDWWGGERFAYGLKPETQLMRYGLAAEDTNAEYRALDVVLKAGETQFRMVTPQGHVQMVSPLTGRVNVYNLLAASCAAMARGLTLEQVAAAAENLRQVPGRFEVVDGSRDAGFTVVVDYAHTDDALKNLMALARDMVKESGGRVITLFGCGGNRDRTKRPKMGKAAGGGSDLVIVTSDNPRNEDPWKIIDEALVGVRETGTQFMVEADRAKAIEMAIRAAKPGDIVLLAGKGHEKVQMCADGPVPFNDMAEAERVLNEVRG
ncbi:MAG: UDP-N-acetylmuramoyl-L-alanyl-D-glutamate--2,6-diaminopimelate ligase [Acidobacteriota bacterium]